MRIEPGTRAIVTGASRGIGRATARGARESRRPRRARRARRSAELEELAAELAGGAGRARRRRHRPRRDRVRGRRTSSTRPAGSRSLVANAGLAHYGPFADQPIEQAEQMVQRQRARHALHGPRRASARCCDRAAGHVVVVSSGAGLRAFPWGAVYGATKAADRGFAEALRHELSGTGVSRHHGLPRRGRDRPARPPARQAPRLAPRRERDRRRAKSPRRSSTGSSTTAARSTSRRRAGARPQRPRAAAHRPPRRGACAARPPRRAATSSLSSASVETTAS